MSHPIFLLYQPWLEFPEFILLLNFLKNIYFIYFLFFWLRQVLVAVHGIFIGHAGSSLWRAGFSLVVACRFAFSS